MREICCTRSYVTHYNDVTVTQNDIHCPQVPSLHSTDVHLQEAEGGEEHDRPDCHALCLTI